MTTTRLRFDVGKQRYTTAAKAVTKAVRLRFDVGKQRYTTLSFHQLKDLSCGLM